MSAGLVTLLLKVSAWCALPFVLRPLLARLSASTRHLLLTLTLAGAAVMPLLPAAAPVWHVPVWHVPTWQAPAWLRLPELVPEPAVEVLPAPPRRELPAALGPRVGDENLAGAPVPVEAGAWNGPRGPGLGPSARRSSELGGSWLAWLSLSSLAWLWLAGVAAVVLRTAASVARAARTVRAATPADDPRAAAAMAQARHRLRFSPNPELRQSLHTPVPFAWRGRSPVVVLPAFWRRWSDERLTVVLVHELAHLRRRDAFALWIGRAAVALWWFHPLVRMADRWARQECEQAADDAVLISGSRASDYAEHLIAIGRALTRPLPSGVALTMSNSPDLKDRLFAILRADRPRHALTRRLTAGASLLALAGVVTLAGMQFAPVARAQEQDPDLDPDVEVETGERIIVGEHETHHLGHHDCGSDCDSDSDSDSDSGSESAAGRGEWKKAYEAHREGRYDEAVPAFEAAAAAGYRPAVATYNAACGLSLSGRAEEALAALGRAVELGLDDPELLAEDSDLDPLRADDRFQALVDDAFERAGERRDPIEHHRHRSAHEALEVLRDSGSEDAGAWSKVGTRLLMLRELDAAAEALENAARFAREAPSTALYNLACAHALDGRKGDALDALQRSIEAGYTGAGHMRRDPDLASLRDEPEFDRLAGLAEDLDLDRFQRGDWWGQIKSHLKHGHGGHGDGGHGDSRYSAERWEPAVDFYRGFVDEHPRLGAGWFNLGYALHYSERFDEAIEALRNARELGFRPATSTYNIACGHSMQDRVDEALAALEEAIELGFHGGNMDHDSDLDNLRQDPRFRSLRLKVRLAGHD